MNKVYYKDSTVRAWVHDIIRAMNADDWRPDYVVGLTRGGLVPAVMLSHYLEVPMETLKVSLRDSDHGPESNLWMAEEAFGYVPKEEQLLADFDYSINAKNILVVDDINDTGATLNWIREDWPSGCLPDHERWKTVWGNNVRFAVLINNEASEFKDVDYVGMSINKLEEPIWCVFPWEEWWR
jgi:hypoxanthine phosphoribosyltransferase